MRTEDPPVTESVSRAVRRPIDRVAPDSSPEVATAQTNGSEAGEIAPRLDLSTFLLLVICTLFVIYTLYFGRVVTIPLMMALLLKLVLSPVVRVLASLRIPEWAGAALVLTGVIAGVGYGIFALSFTGCRMGSASCRKVCPRSRAT